MRNRAPSDKVIAQDPEPGTEIDVGDEVTLTVSNGPGTAAVPDVEDLPREQARKRLRRAGFRVRERREESDDVDRGRVVRTVPPIGSQVQVGSTVTLVVSSGPGKVTVPDVTGSDVEDARAELEAAELSVAVTREESDEADPDTVLRQDPAGGTSVDKRSTVTLVVAEEPEQVDVPSVEGRDEADAVRRVSAAGLEVNVEDRAVDTPSEDGKVLEQSPAGGRKAERGSRVTLVVGRFDPDLNPDPGRGGEEPPPEDGGGGTGAVPGAAGMQG